MKKFIAALLAGLTLFTLVGCSGGSKADSSTPKDYSQIIHDARSDEDNKYEMIFTKGEDGKFTAQYGYSAEYEADQLSDEVANMMMPLLGLEEPAEVHGALPRRPVPDRFCRPRGDCPHRRGGHGLL